MSFGFLANFLHEIWSYGRKIVFASLTHEGEDVGDLLVIEVDVRWHDVGVVFAIDGNFPLQAFWLPVSHQR